MLLRQKTKQSRNLINNPRICEDVANGIRNMLACANTSDRYNATFGTDDLNCDMLKGAIMDSSVGGCAIATGGKHCDTPSDRRYASAIKGIEQTQSSVHLKRRWQCSLTPSKDWASFQKKDLT